MQIPSKLPTVGTTIFAVMSALAQEHDAVNLGQGFPDFPVPESLQQALIRALVDGKNQYSPTTGVAALRVAIADKTRRCYGMRPHPDTDITVTAGASEAIFNALLAVVRSGDEVIVFDPCYDCYVPAITLAGGRAVHIALDQDTFGVDWDLVRAAITPRTRLLIVNTPHNPSGAVLTAADLANLASIVGDTDILLLADEVYEHMVYDGARHESVLRYPELAARSFVVSSFGKTYHCTGWRVGYCIAPAPLTTEFRKVHQYNSFCAFTPAQWAFADVLAAHPEHYENLSAFYEVKRDRFATKLRATRLKPLPVPGGYFQLADYGAVSDLSDAEFCSWLAIEKGVAAIPLSPFYAVPPVGQRLVRLCFAKHDATVDAAIARLAVI